MKYARLIFFVFFLFEAVQLHASGDDQDRSEKFIRDSNGSPFYFYIKPRSLSNASMTSDLPSSRSVSSETINPALVFVCCKGINSSRCSSCRKNLSCAVRNLCDQISLELQTARDRGQEVRDRYKDTVKFYNALQNQQSNLAKGCNLNHAISEINTSFNNYNYSIQSITESVEFKKLQKLSDHHLRLILQDK